MRRLLLLVAIAYCFCNIKAQVSKVNVTIDGPGVVDEYLMTSADGTKQVKLKAVPSKFLGDVAFDGWSGDATGTNEELTVSADKAQNIHATFTFHRPVKQYPLIGLKKSWADMGKPFYYEMPTIWETQDMSLGRGANYLPVDYNRDGYIDYVQFPKRGGMGIDNHRENVRFWLGMPDGTFDEDPKNDNRLTGAVYPCNMKYADLNDDGFPDFVCFSSGYDRKGSTGDYPVILMSGTDGVYTELAFTDYDNGYYHGGATGDFDNDGDIDVLFWDMWKNWGQHSLYLENDGKGNFKEIEATELIDWSVFRSTLPERAILGYNDMEVTDLNNDGYNDLIMLMGDFPSDGENPGAETYGYLTPPIVFWGNSSGKFGGVNYTLLPPPRQGYGDSCSFVFYDINGDGVKEIIVDKSGDGQFGSTAFKSGYLQVNELEGDHYVEKTGYYIPVENHLFNETKGEGKAYVQTIDGTDYYITFMNDILRPWYKPELKVYAFRNGIMEPVESDSKTKISSYEEGLPIYVDGPLVMDRASYYDGMNPVDTMAEHGWAPDADWDAVGGNMWRINLYHRENTHYGRTCIRWDRAGQDPSKEYEQQQIDFCFMSDVDISDLINNDCYLELYIKNSDPELSLIINPYDINPVSMDAKNTDEGYYTGEWQRMTTSIRNFKINRLNTITITADKGDLNNEFYIDDIRIRRLAHSATDYERAFNMGYVSNSYSDKDRSSQITSLEFKLLLKPLVEKFAPDSIDYFNYRISDYDVPIIRGTAVIMAFYVARCLGVTDVNSQEHHSGEANFWDGAWGTELGQVLPHANDPLVESPDGWQESICALLWNDDHISPFSGRQVVAYVGKGECYAWDKPFTWEDAICAITRLYDSLDPERVAAGISMPIAYPTKTKDDVFFNMNGQRVPHPLKGVYIKNGKKVIIRSEQH